jgi:prepilin peptidase CpaA
MVMKIAFCGARLQACRSTVVSTLVRWHYKRVVKALTQGERLRVHISDMTSVEQQLLLTTLVIAAAAFDLRTRRIPNWLCATGLLCGFACQIVLFKWTGAREAALGAGLALLIYIPLFALRAVGGGDVKLMAAVGSLAGPKSWIAIFLITAIVGGAIALVMIAVRGRFARTLRNMGTLLTELAHLRAPYRVEPELDVSSGQGLRLPHGCAIAAGTLLYLAYSVASGGVGSLR